MSKQGIGVLVGVLFSVALQFTELPATVGYVAWVATGLAAIWWLYVHIMEGRRSSAKEILSKQLREITQLSDDIIRFKVTTEPQLEVDHWRHPDESNQRQQRDSKHFMSEYSRLFSGRVIAAHLILGRLGVPDKDGVLYNNPTNPLGIRWVAERLAARVELVYAQRPEIER